METKKSKRELKTEYERIKRNEKLIAFYKSDFTLFLTLYAIAIIGTILILITPEENLDKLEFLQPIASIFPIGAIYGTLYFIIIFLLSPPINYEFYENHLILTTKPISILNYDEISKIKFNFSKDARGKYYRVTFEKENHGGFLINNKKFFYIYNRILPNKLIDKINFIGNYKVDNKEKQKVLLKTKPKNNIWKL